MRRDNDDHGGGSRLRTSWRIDRLQKMHELGRAFGLTDDANDPPDVEPDERNSEQLELRPTEST